jgi:hypothetical protein
MLPDQRVVGVDHGEVVTGLVFEDAQLGVDVVLVGWVAVQMVFADVEQGRHGRPERADPLQLERADLGHHPFHLFARFHQVDERLPDVSPHVGGKAVCLEYLSRKGRRRGLAVGAGNGDERRGNETAGQFDLAYDLPAGGLSLYQHRVVLGHARGDNDQVARQEICRVVTSQHEADVAPAEFRGHGRQGRCIPHIRGSDPGAGPGQEPGARHPGSGQAHDEDVFVGQFHVCLVHSVVSTLITLSVSAMKPSAFSNHSVTFSRSKVMKSS